MNDRVLIPFGSEVLVLLPDEFEAARARGRELLQPAPVALPSAELVDAAEMARRSGKPASWWMRQARERRVPFRRLGRSVRFEPDTALAAVAADRRVIPDGSIGQSIRRGRASA